MSSKTFNEVGEEVGQEPEEGEVPRLPDLLSSGKRKVSKNWQI